MKFKHTFNVFVDNFSVIYKQLLYRLVVSLISGLICFAVVYPFIRGLIDSPSFNALVDNIKGFISHLLHGEVGELRGLSAAVRDAYAEFMKLLQTKIVQIVLSGLLLLLIYMISKWFNGLGNFAASAVINDRMALHTNSHFMSTLISNLAVACAYNAIYVPLSIIFDIAMGVGAFFLMYALVHSFLPFYIGVFLFMTITIFALSVKMTFTSDWLPALIRGKMKQKQALIYTFSRKNKNTLNVLSNFVVLVLIIFGVNVAAFICTFGVGLLLTIPSSFVILLCFELVNYYDREEIKYFIDNNNIIKPVREHEISREEFFRGDDD